MTGPVIYPGSDGRAFVVGLFAGSGGVWVAGDRMNAVTTNDGGHYERLVNNPRWLEGLRLNPGAEWPVP